MPRIIFTDKSTSIRNDGDTRVDYYGDSEAEDHFNLGLYNDHYFINDKTNITSFRLENCTDVMAKIVTQFTGKTETDIRGRAKGV